MAPSKWDLDEDTKGVVHSLAEVTHYEEEMLTEIMAKAIVFARQHGIARESAVVCANNAVLMTHATRDEKKPYFGQGSVYESILRQIRNNFAFLGVAN